MSERPVHVAMPTVLIVDDEAPIAEIVAAIVEDAGYTPVIATHGREALEIARARRPALLITDLMMPQLTGGDLIAALRADAMAAGQSAPPAILMTAASLTAARAAAADVVLRKPFALDELEALLHHFLSDHTKAGASREHGKP